MAQRIPISEAKRAQMVVLKQEGYTLREIGDRLACHYSSVSYVLKKFKEKKTLKNLDKSGRPKKTTNREDNLLRRSCVANPFHSSSQIKQELPQLNISERTIRRRLAEKFSLRAR